jgi:hypothetical protein
MEGTLDVQATGHVFYQRFFFILSVLYFVALNQLCLFVAFNFLFFADIFPNS